MAPTVDIGLMRSPSTESKARFETSWDLGSAFLLFFCANMRKLTDSAPIKEFSERHYFNNHSSASLMFVNTRPFTHRFRITFSPNLVGSI